MDSGIITEKIIEDIEEKKERKMQRLSIEQLLESAKKTPEKASKRQTLEGTVYIRNSYVKALALRLADGTCQLCEEPAPFRNKKGNPYLESHHINWLSRDGEDSIENTIALCPNCHKKMHVLDKNQDVVKLKGRNIELLKSTELTKLNV